MHSGRTLLDILADLAGPDERTRLAADEELATTLLRLASQGAWTYKHELGSQCFDEVVQESVANMLGLIHEKPDWRPAVGTGHQYVRTVARNLAWKTVRQLRSTAGVTEPLDSVRDQPDDPDTRPDRIIDDDYRKRRIVARNEAFDALDPGDQDLVRRWLLEGGLDGLVEEEVERRVQAGASDDAVTAGMARDAVRQRVARSRKALKESTLSIMSKRGW